MKELLKLLLKSLPEDFQFTIQKTDTEVKIKILYEDKTVTRTYPGIKVNSLQNWIIAEDIKSMISLLKPE